MATAATIARRITRDVNARAGSAAGGLYLVYDRSTGRPSGVFFTEGTDFRVFDGVVVRVGRRYTVEEISRSLLDPDLGVDL